MEAPITHFGNVGYSPITADVHAHTCHSHGQAGTFAMFEAARARGLAVFGFSEHSPRPAGYVYPQDYQEKLVREFPDYVREVGEAARRGRELGVTVLLGLEVDAIAGHEDFAAALCREYPYDYVIGGLHFQGTWGFDGPASEWAPLSRKERFAVYERYYEDLARMCRTGLFQIAAHPDLVKIHSVEDFHAWLESPEAPDRIRAALAAMKDAGMAMEVSSAGLRKPCREIYPCPLIMNMAAELSLPVSFGSDAHCADTPAFAFDRLARYAHSFGYGESVVFMEGKPHSRPFSVSSPLKG